MLVGLYAGGVATGMLGGNVHYALAAHLTALLAGLLLVAVGVTIPRLRWGETGRRRLANLLLAGSAANVAFNIVKAIVDVRALELTGDAVNDVLFAFANAFIVLPHLVGIAAWTWGLRPATGSARADG
jgi:hypothetical protein